MNIVGDVYRMYSISVCIFFYTMIVSIVKVSEDLLSQHYCELRTKPFYPSLLLYMTSGPVVVMVRAPLHGMLLY